MAKVEENYKALADGLHLKLGVYDKRYVLYGRREEYEVLLYVTSSSYPYQFSIAVTARPTGDPVSQSDMKEFKKKYLSVLAFNQDGNRFVLDVKATGNQRKLLENVEECLTVLIDFLRENGYEPCCQFCGQHVETAGYMIGSGFLQACPECMEKMLRDRTASEVQKQGRKENLLAGLVGAFFGSLLGVACILIFSQLGRVAAISGVVMACCTLKGYEMLAGKLTKKGILASILLILFMVYIGDRLDWTIFIVREVGSDWGIGFVDAFRYVPEFLADGVIESGSYWGNLVLLYLFTLGGAIPMIVSMVKENKTGNRVLRIGSGTESGSDLSGGVY